MGTKIRSCDVVPHGFEGQGPEHSSGSLERFLQLAAENNWTVANLTSAAQYFHILEDKLIFKKRGSPSTYHYDTKEVITAS